MFNLLTRYTCAYAQCAEGISQPNGNQICLTNYDALDLAQYNCYLYKCDDLIQYEHNGSGEIYLNFFLLLIKFRKDRVFANLRFHIIAKI